MGRIRAFPLSASGVVGGTSGSATSNYAVTIHSMILTETGGTTNETLTFYTAAAAPNQLQPAAPSASGTEQFEVIVPKGTTLVVNDIGGHGLYFPDGLYVAASGGTLSGVIAIS